MPTYGLRCRSCGNDFELFRLRTLRDDEMTCPKCGSSDVKLGVGGGYFHKTASSESPAACPSASTCPSATSPYG